MDEELLADFDSFTAPTEEVAMVEPTAVSEVAPLLSDFDTFAQEQQPQIDPIEQHRPPEVDDNTWMDIKERVSKFLSPSETKKPTPIVQSLLKDIGLTPEFEQIPQESILEKIGAETSDVAKAHELRGLSENYEFEFKDLKDTWDSAVSGDKEAQARLLEKKDKVNNNVVNTLKQLGIEAYYSDGKLEVVVEDEDGNETLKELDEDVLVGIASGFSASGGEISAGIGMASYGAAQGLKFGKTPATKAAASLIFGLAGGYVGSTTGSLFDLTRSAVELNKEIDVHELFKKSTARGVADITGAAVVGLAAKGVSKAVAPLGKMSDRMKTLFKQGDIQGAKRVVKEDYGLTDKNIDELFESVSKDIAGLEDLTGDDLLRAKLTAAIQQQPQGKALITSAIRVNAKAAIETSKEIDFRAKQVMNAANQFSKKPSAIKKSIQAYEKVVAKNYGQVKGMIDEALPNYKPELDTASFSETLTKLNKRVVDPDVRLKVENLAEVLGNQKNETVGNLIETRQLFNKFYGKNLSHFENVKDKKALLSIQKTIDSKIDEAIETLPNEIGKQLNAAFKDAKSKYAKMFKTQDTATYNAIFRKGASEEDIGKSLLKYSKSADADLEGVLSKLSKVQRTKSEFSILKQMVDSATAKGEAKAIDFTALLEDIGTSKSIFKTPEAKQFLKNIEAYDKKFAKDVDIQRIASGVAPKVEKNIATSMMGKIIMKISALRFEALQRMMPTETGRRLSLQKSIESALEKSRTPREFFFNASKIKGMPNKERIALKKAVKEIGEKEELLKKQMVLQKEKNRKAVLEAQTKKQEVESKKILTEQEFKKAKMEKAKEDWEKRKISEQAQKAKDEAVVPIGGSEDEAKKAVKNVFAKPLDADARYKAMSKEDIAEMERLDAEEAKAMFGDVKPKGKEVVHPINKKTYILADDGTVYFHRKINDTWKESININQKKEIKELAEKGEKAFLESRKEISVKIEMLDNLPESYKNLELSKTQEDFFKRAIPKKEELKKETERFIAKKSPSPKKLYRGEVLEGEERIGGGAKEGYGLYTTVDTKLAKEYGAVKEMNPTTDLPKKPLVFTGMNEFEIWEQTLDYKVLKYKRASEKGDVTLNEIVNLIDPSIDGIQIGSGIGAKSGTYWVKFPSIEEFREFSK